MEKKKIVVIPEYLNRSASRDEELKPLPVSKMFDNLKASFEWSFESELLGEFFGWHAPVYLVSGNKLIMITKTTDKMIMEDELSEALEGLKAVCYTPRNTLYYDTDEYTFQISERGYGRKKWEEMIKQNLNSVYGETAKGRDDNE